MKLSFFDAHFFLVPLQGLLFQEIEVSKFPIYGREGTLRLCLRKIDLSIGLFFAIKEHVTFMKIAYNSYVIHQKPKEKISGFVGLLDT